MGREKSTACTNELLIIAGDQSKSCHRITSGNTSNDVSVLQYFIPGFVPPFSAIIFEGSAFMFLFRSVRGIAEKRLLASSCLSHRPSVRTEQLGSHWTDFHEISYCSFTKYHTTNKCTNCMSFYFNL